jgi:hypothetical protein
MVAIIADLITWKAKDAKFRDPDNPWRAILGVYAGRRIKKPGKNLKAVRSVSGTPTRDRHIPDLGDYMFNELVSASWGSPVPSDTPPEAEPEHPGEANSQPEGAGDEMQASGEDPIGSDRVTANASAEDDVAETEPLTPARAQVWAEAIFERNPFKTSIYWPKEGVERDDYSPDKLVPALERWVASEDTWGGAERFLAAARLGRGREFIEQERQSGIRVLTKDLLAGDDKALAQARAVGLTA